MTDLNIISSNDLEKLFRCNVSDRLLTRGFVAFPRSKGLVYTQGPTQVAFLRLGGRLARPGTITYFIGVRHAFLRDLEGELTRSWTTEGFHYPFKFGLEEFRDFDESSWVYQPRNLNLPISRIGPFESEGSASSVLFQVCAFLMTRGPLLAKALTPLRALKELQRNGEDAYCEKMWLEDYRGALPT